LEIGYREGEKGGIQIENVQRERTIKMGGERGENEGKIKRWSEEAFLGLGEMNKSGAGEAKNTYIN